MLLKCKCGNEEDFSEETIVWFVVDAEGNREEKVKQETRYFCMECKEEVEFEVTNE